VPESVFLSAWRSGCASPPLCRCILNADLEGRPDGTIEFIAGESENGNPVDSNGDDAEVPASHRRDESSSRPSVSAGVSGGVLTLRSDG
jgi:hypothetical protein